MAAYVVAHIEVTDPEGYAEYVKGVPSTIAKYGGRYLARGGKTDRLEGSAPVHRLVILEFPSVEKAREWYGSEEYRRLLRIRQANSRGEVTLIEGVSG